MTASNWGATPDIVETVQENQNEESNGTTIGIWTKHIYPFNAFTHSEIHPVKRIEPGKEGRNQPSQVREEGLIDSIHFNPFCPPIHPISSMICAMLSNKNGNSFPLFGVIHKGVSVKEKNCKV